MAKKAKSRPVSLDVIDLDEVFHIGALKPGTLKPSRRKRTRSFEGPGISVSLVPTAWRSIVKLGGLPLFALFKPDGTPGRFVDLTSAENRTKLERMVLDSGLVVPVQSYFVEIYDEEGEVSGELEVPTFALALREADENEDAIREGVGYKPTKSLLDWWSKSFTESMPFPFEMATLKLLEEQTDLDGAWWNEELDPIKLSAPRGVIFPNRQVEWKAVEIDWSEAPDAEDEWSL